MSAHFKEPLSMTTLAAYVHGSTSYLRHTYKQVTGITPQQKLTELRLTEAARLLASTSQSVNWIAADAGLPNVPYFTTTFKTKFHATPRQYRKEHQHADR
nr:AraC family transcriptional regulator [Secundilactobacillus collinoides]